MPNVYEPLPPLPDESDALDDYLEKAANVMLEAHAGQFRKNGAAYETHPRTVAAIFERKSMRIIGLLHDVLEDAEQKYDAEKLRQMFPEWVVARLVILTRKPDEDYFDYIERVNTDDACREIKLADLWHNLSDSRPGSRRDKYRFAQHYLNTVRPLGPALPLHTQPQHLLSAAPP